MEKDIVKWNEYAQIAGIFGGVPQNNMDRKDCLVSSISLCMPFSCNQFLLIIMKPLLHIYLSQCIDPRHSVDFDRKRGSAWSENKFCLLFDFRPNRMRLDFYWLSFIPGFFSRNLPSRHHKSYLDLKSMYNAV